MGGSPFIRDTREMGWHGGGGDAVRLHLQHASSPLGSCGLQEVIFPLVSGCSHSFQELWRNGCSCPQKVRGHPSHGMAG